MPLGVGPATVESVLGVLDGDREAGDIALGDGGLAPGGRGREARGEGGEGEGGEAAVWIHSGGGADRIC